MPNERLGINAAAYQNPKGTLRVALVGKYINHQDAYKSVTEAIDHAGYANRLQIELQRIESDALKKIQNGVNNDGIDVVVVPVALDDVALKVCSKPSNVPQS